MKLTLSLTLVEEEARQTVSVLQRENIDGLRYFTHHNGRKKKRKKKIEEEEKTEKVLQ